MMYLIAFFLILLVVTPNIQIGRADQEAGNRPHIQTDQYGQLYAKSFPYDRFGPRGITKVYQIGRKDRSTGLPQKDTLLHTYDWFTKRLYLAGLGGHQVYVVQMGPWARGHEASSDHLAIAFHKNGEILKRYTTLDIVSDSNNVSASVSHYNVFTGPGIIRRPSGNKFVFDITSHDGPKWTFDLETGNRLLFMDQKLESK